MCGYCMILHDIADYLHEWCVDDHRVFCRASNANMFDIDLAYLVFWPLGYVACPKIHCKWMNVNFSEHGMMLQASAVSPVDPGPFGGVACRQGEKMQKDLKGFEFHYDSRCSTLWICWRCLNVVLICSDQALFYVVSPRRCNHPVVQRNNQQGPRLLLEWLLQSLWCHLFRWQYLARMVATIFVMPFVSLAVVGAFFQLVSLFVSVILTDWLCLLVCVDAVDAVDGYQVTKAIEQAAGEVSGAFGGVACSHFFIFVSIGKLVAFWSRGHLISKSLLTFDAAIMVPYSDCFWQRHNHHQAVPCSSQWNLRLVFQFCLFCMFLLLMNVVVSSTTRCQNKTPVHFVFMFWYVCVLVSLRFFEAD